MGIIKDIFILLKKLFVTSNTYIRIDNNGDIHSNTYVTIIKGNIIKDINGTYIIFNITDKIFIS